MVNLFRYKVLDKAGAYHDACSVASHGTSFHVRTVAPFSIRGNQLEANLVFKYMRRWVNLNM
ncbi:MAG TPA: hypothetical protein VM711_10720 [Sphingomicrobium sp.]|nr:hypothetical protein [Sphingomicrobium sp.]